MCLTSVSLTVSEAKGAIEEEEGHVQVNAPELIRISPSKDFRPTSEMDDLIRFLIVA
jgi:hypothetical protein